jgi:hypothetical protein
MNKFILDENGRLSAKKNALLRRIMERTIISSKIEGIYISEEKAYQMAIKIASQVEREAKSIRA